MYNKSAFMVRQIPSDESHKTKRGAHYVSINLFFCVEDYDIFDDI